MDVFLSLGLGYCAGMISPAAMFGKIKKVDLKKSGTKNLGASNATLLLGKGLGLLIMVLDIMKSMLAGKLARWLFPGLKITGHVACLGAMLGHIWPVWLRFSGGKGLACYGGLVLFYNGALFWFYLIFGTLLMVLLNRSVVLPLFVALSFPVVVWITSGDPAILAVPLAASLVLLFVHRGNFGRVERGDEAPMREIIAYIFKRK